MIDAEEKLRFAERMAHALRRLDLREKFIIRERWLGDHILTLAALGRKLHVSRERVRQLERRAQLKLREMMLSPRTGATRA